MSRSILLALLLAACAGAAPTPISPARSAVDPVDARCAWPSRPTVLARAAGASLQVWQLEDSPVLAMPVIPDDREYLAFRAAIRRAGADVVRPVFDRPPATTDADREMWRREDRNAELVHTGKIGRIRRIACLEALLLAYQNRQQDELTHPTEFLASILRKRVGDRTRLRVYFTGGSAMYPPKQLYGLDRVARARQDGWELWVVLHNHTVQKNRGRPALGPAVPSTSDVELLRGLAADLHMAQARVTNGFYTVEVSAAELGSLETRN